VESEEKKYTKEKTGGKRKEEKKKQRRENKTERMDDTKQCFCNHFKVFTSRQKSFSG
jgi:hypothetical protein